MDDEARKGAGLDLLRAVWRRRKWLTVAVFAAPFAATVSFAAFLPDIYRSTALVLVERQQVPEEFVRPTVTSPLETRLQTISQEILSRSRLEGLSNRFGLYADLRTRVTAEEVIQRMRRDIKLELKGVETRERGRRATIAFTISYQGTDPRKVAMVTNTLASFYIEENLKVRERQAAGTAEFLKAQLDQVKARLDSQEARLGEFKKRFVGQLPQDLTVNLATLERLNAQLRLNHDSQTRALERHAALVKQLAESGWGGIAAGAEGAPDATALRLARLRQELTELRTRFSDKYPDVVRVKAEIALLEQQLAEGKRENPKELHLPLDPQAVRLRQALAEAEAEIKALKAEEKRLRADIAAYQRRVQETPLREQESQELSRDYDSTRELYASLLKRHAESQLAESMEQRQKGEQFRIIDPAIAAEQPAAPNRERLFLVGLLLALGTAAGAVVLAEQLDTSFHTVDDLRAFTPVPVLVSIPRIVRETDIRRRRRRLWLATASALLGTGLIVGASYLVARGNEQFVWMLAGRFS